MAADTRSMDGAAPQPAAIQKIKLTVVDGPGAGATWESIGDRCAIGSHPSNDLRLEDPTVSRFHCEITLSSSGARIRDLESRNGTVIDAIQVVDGYLRSGALIHLGHSVIRCDFGSGKNVLPLSEREQFGGLVGKSIPMRTTFSLLEKAAASTATVLLEGETGTGKEEAARSIHRQGARSGGPFVVVDCSAIPPNLLESELFGHEKGAFTGAVDSRLGTLAEADGGTVFLDELGELPLELQPKLLRVLEERQVRRIGARAYQPIDLRVIAATNRDLRAEVNAGRFRADLYYRLAVVRILMPPLRHRPEDLKLLVDKILGSFGAGEAIRARFTSDEFLSNLRRSSWPGNVRELRNHLERCLVLDDLLPVEEVARSETGFAIDLGVPFTEARDRALAAFEREYLAELLRVHGGKVARAAEAAGIHRNYLYKLLQRHRIVR